MKQINPILVLAGATAKSGHMLFARDLLEIDGGVSSAAEVIKLNPEMRGFDVVSVAYVVDNRIKGIAYWEMK